MPVYWTRWKLVSMNTRAVLHQYMTTVAHGPNKEIEAVLSCYRGNNNFLALTKAIELVCRQHLDVRTDPSDVMLYIQDRGRCPKDGGRYLFVGDHDCFSRYSFTKNGFTQICYKIVEHNSNTFICHNLCIFNLTIDLARIGGAIATPFPGRIVSKHAGSVTD